MCSAVQRSACLLKQFSIAGCQESSRLALKVCGPGRPFGLLEVGQRSVAALVLNVKKIGTLAQDQVHKLKVGSVGPTGIMEWAATIVIRDGKGNLCVLDQKGSDFEHSFSAGHVQEGLAEFVAALQGTSGFLELAEGGHVLRADGSKGFVVVGGNFLFGGSVEKVLHGRGRLESCIVLVLC